MSNLFNLAAFKETIYDKYKGHPVEIHHDNHLNEAMSWLMRAQDATKSGGVSWGYSLGWNLYFKKKGWQPAYPEVTGYIVPTFFDYYHFTNPHGLLSQRSMKIPPSPLYQRGARGDFHINHLDYFQRAIRMADWEIEVQMKNGAVQGGTINEASSPAIFNTGQVIQGWTRAFQETKDERYSEASIKAANFLLKALDADGAWRKENSRFARSDATTYNSKVGFSLIQLGDILNEPQYYKAGIKNIDYSIHQQFSNGWFQNNCLSDPEAPLLHTICYAAEGILNAGILLNNTEYLASAQKTADALLAKLKDNGSLSGRFSNDWSSQVDWSCLTGNAQLAVIWLKLYKIIRDKKYFEAAECAISFLKKTQNRTTSKMGLRGGIKGSFPFDGKYGRYQILSWPTKYFVDALLLLSSILSEEDHGKS